MALPWWQHHKHCPGIIIIIIIIIIGLLRHSHLVPVDAYSRCYVMNIKVCRHITAQLHQPSTVRYLTLTLLSPETIIVPHRLIWSWYTGRWWVGCYIWYSEEGTGRDRSPPRLLLAVPNVTAHPSTADIPITVLLYNGALLCGFNVSIRG